MLPEQRSTSSPPETEINVNRKYEGTASLSKNTINAKNLSKVLIPQFWRTSGQTCTSPNADKN